MSSTSRNGFGLSTKELLYIIVLIGLFVLITGGLLSLHGSKVVDMASAFDALRPPKTYQFRPSKEFVLNHDALGIARDDEHLELEGFYYLMLWTVTTTEKDIMQDSIPTFSWDSLKDIRLHSEYMGKVTQKMTGSVIDLQRFCCSGTLAQKYGLDGMFYWRAAISDEKGRVHIVMLPEFPEGISHYQTVEFYGRFWKVWVYDSLKGRKAKSPLFFAKVLRPQTIQPDMGFSKIHWTTCVYFVIIFVVMIIAIWRDHVAYTGRTNSLR